MTAFHQTAAGAIVSGRLVNAVRYVASKMVRRLTGFWLSSFSRMCEPCAGTLLRNARLDVLPMRRKMFPVKAS